VVAGSTTTIIPSANITIGSNNVITIIGGGLIGYYDLTVSLNFLQEVL